MRIIAADFGTSSVKTGVFDGELSELVTAKAEYGYNVNGLYAQIDPELIWTAFLDTLKKLGDPAKDADAIVIDNFSPSVIAMDRDGNALYPCIIHLDRRSYPQSRQALRLVPRERFLSVNGNLPFAGGISLTSILWLMQNEPEVISRTVCIGHLSTFILKRLTGGFYIDPTNASFTGLYETFSGKGWSDELTEALGIDAGLLPEIRPSISVIGRISREVSALTGLRESMSIVMGSNDSAAGAYGAGAVSPGDIMNISGSSEIMTITTDNPVPHPRLYCRTSVEEGMWLYLSITVGGFAIEWFRKNFCREMSMDEFYTDYMQSVASQRPREGVRFLPHLSGDRHSLVKKKGGFSGLTVDTTREDMLRALLSGTFEPMKTSLSIIGRTTELNKRIFLTGGVVSEPYQRFKEREFAGYTFQPRANCSLLGIVKAAVKALGQE